MTLEFSKEEEWGNGRTIRKKTISAKLCLYVVATEEHDDFYDKLYRNKKRKDDLKKLNRTLDKISQQGIAHSLIVGTLRQLDHESGLHEVRMPGSSLRVFAYANEITDKLVLIKDFSGHGGSSQIPPDKMNAMVKAAQAIKEYLKEDEQ